MKATGGVPVYHWEVTAVALPPGLRLDSFTGAVSGSPARAGASEFTVRVRDYDEKAPGVSRKLKIEVAAN